MQTKFKVGDIVRCINPIGSLMLNNLYTIKESDPTFPDYNCVEGCSASYFPNRFQCVDNTIEGQIAKAKTFLNEKVEYYSDGETTKFTPTDIQVFFAGSQSPKISMLVNTEVKMHGFCVALASSVKTVPVNLISKAKELVVIVGVGDYEATIHEDHVMVGCQKISKAKVLEIAKAFESKKG